MTGSLAGHGSGYGGGMAEKHTWSIQNLNDVSPLEYLIRTGSGEWEGDEDSQAEAMVSIVASTFASAGLDSEEAIDKAIEFVSSGVSFTFDGENVSFDRLDEVEGGVVVTGELGG